MEASLQRQLLVAEVKSMVTLLTDRLGTDNPWLLVDFDALPLDALASARRLMHELLYAPPPRQR